MAMRTFCVACSNHHVVLCGPWEEDVAIMVAAQATLESTCEYVVVPMMKIPDEVLQVMGVAEAPEQREVKNTGADNSRGYL